MLFDLLLAPITAPVSGFNFLLRQIRDMAERELYDPERIREEILLLQMKLEEGEITEEEYNLQEAELLVRWRAARDYLQGQGR
jgi:hypothetical protein